ncbi:hypothetical protein ACOME3_002408 [Neoechinorhynchus agilis]
MEQSAAAIIDRKIFNDSIHGHIELHPLLVRIIDTVQFQRLRDIKQLSTAHYVYPGACHSRLEHSIGVCHLAGNLIRSLQTRQPELGISERDVLCVEIAGLCHDIGHGPFSHLFEQFVEKVRPHLNWKHERNSILMLEHLITRNNLRPMFAAYNLHEDDIAFIKSLIDIEGEPRVENEKSFLYEIVANKRTGVDADKWDYFARDCQYLGVRSMFDHNRYIKFARVILGDDGQLHIGTREKAHSVLTFVVNGRHRTLADSIDDLDVFERLTDNILYLIRNSEDPRLEESRNILRRISERNLYRLIGIAAKSEEDNQVFKSDDPQVCVSVIEYKFGVNGNDPTTAMCFYNKRNTKKSIANQFHRTTTHGVLPDLRDQQCISSDRGSQKVLFYKLVPIDDRGYLNIPT